MGPSARDNDEIHAGRKEIRPRPETLAAHSLDSVALDGRAYPAAHDEPHPGGRESRARAWLSGNEECEVRGDDTTSGTLRVNELDMTAQAATRPERVGGRA